MSYVSVIASTLVLFSTSTGSAAEVRSSFAEESAVEESAPETTPSGYEQSYEDELAATVAAVESKRFLHGFRLGWLYLMGKNTPGSFFDRYDLKSRHQFIIGYEVTWRMVGHDWLNVLLVGNFLITGIEQSRFFPSGNGLIGFELAEAVQMGVGMNLTPTRDKPAHMLVAAGWTPKIGDIYLPVHAFFIPDVDREHRTGVTVGVNF